MAAKKEKSVLVGALLGLVFPGLGLFYAAPIIVALAAAIAAGVVLGVLGWVPLVGGFLSKVAWAALAACSGVLGALYARSYNLKGERAPLGLEGRAWRLLR